MSTIQLSFNDNYSEIYGQTYIDKMNYLVKAITEYETSEDQFNVLNFETGLGKSYTVDRLLLEITNYHWDIKKKYLIVKRFNEESIKSEKYINSEFIQTAVAITHDNWNKWQNKLDDLQHMKVVIISHQRYISLCENEELRKAFTNKRDTLIIDEKINFPVFTYNDKRYTTIYSILPHKLRTSLEKVTKPLNEFINMQIALKNTNKVFTHKFKLHPATLRNFIQEIKISLDNKTITGSEHRKIIIDFLNELHLFYTNQCIYNSGNISTYQTSHKHWGLKNNIILDASGAIDGVYLINPKKYNIINQTRIIDHKDCEFNVIKFNSSKSKINKQSSKYFDELTEKILENKKDNDKILIVTHKDYAERVYNKLNKQLVNDDLWIDKRNKETDPDYQNQSIAISWYGNLIGKNWAGDFTQVWLLSTPNIPLEHYLIHYLQYSDDKIGNKSTQVYKGKFKNTYFNTVQNGYIAAEMYQSLKRIQRVAKPKGKFYIVCEDEYIVDTILSQIKNAKVTNVIELDFKKEEEENKPKKIDQVDKFLEYILVQDKGNYKKSDISKQLKITKLNRVLSDTRVKTIVNKKLLIHTRHIEVI